MESSEAKRAYYIEYPDMDMAVIIRHDEDECEIWTSTDLLDGAQEHLIAVLMTDGFETFAYTSETYDEGSRRKWRSIDPADLPEVTLAVEGPDGVMYGKRHQLRQGQVVCANENREKGKSAWHVDGAAPPEHCVEPVPAPPYFKG